MTKKTAFLALTIILLTPLAVSARTPTNDAAAFKTLSLYADRTALMNTIDHTGFNAYPASLASPPPLLVMRPTPGSPDTMALFNSFAKDAIYFEVNATQPQSFSTYTVSPPQFATSLGSLLMGVNIYGGSGAFADFGKQLATATVTYVDGDTTIARLNVGTFVRDYFDSGPLTCGSNQALYETRPTDGRSAYLYESGGNYFDAQEFLLPKLKRAKRIVSIRVEGTLLDHFCSSFVPHIYAGSRFSGVSIWPNFVVRNAMADTVVRQSQTTHKNHGGYLSDGFGVVGWRRTTDVTGCQVASMAMTYTYAGFACTVESLNVHLQRKKGYEPDQVARLLTVSPSGSTVTYTPMGGTKLIPGDTFLVEHGYRTNPVATYQVTTPGQATRIAAYAGTASPGDPGRVYWKMIPRVADSYTHGPQLRSVDLNNSPQLAAQVESLLVRDIPVQVNVHATPTSGHFVVASGWTSSFRSGESARGTYWLQDPYDLRNFRKLIESRVIVIHGT